MKIGALIVTTGLPRVSGVTALCAPVGVITAGQRIISSFQCAVVSVVGLVVGKEDKKTERQFAQNGVVFLRCEDPNADFFAGLQTGLAFMQGKCDRVFIVPADAPLFLPQTVCSLCNTNTNIALPEYKYMQGFPILLDGKAMAVICAQKNAACAVQAVQQHGLQTVSVPVEDPGILLRGKDMSRRKALIRRHNSQLSRPVMEVALHSGGLLYDSRVSMLLHLVEETRSVRNACSLMQISYSTAWNMLNHVEDELGFPLVERMRGGSAGSGSILTEKGKRLMDAYDSFCEALNIEAKQLYTKIFDM